MLIRLLAIHCVLLTVSGCSTAPAASVTAESKANPSQSNILTPQVTLPAKGIPAEYVTLATILSVPISADPDSFQRPNNFELTLQENIMTLKGLHPVDQDLTHIKDLTLQVYQDAAQSLQRVKALPQLQDDGNLMLEAFIFGALGDIKHGLDLGAQNDQVRKAFLKEFEALCAGDDTLEVANQLLVKVIERYTPQAFTSAAPFIIDFDESIVPTAIDCCKLYNSGPTRKNCTIIVELTGAQGQVQKNVHFLREWKADTWVYCPYSSGMNLNGKIRGCKTVLLVKKVKVTVHDAEQTTTQDYQYDEAKKAEDVKAHCDLLRFTCKYRPYDPGILITDERGVVVTLSGQTLPACKVTLSFIKGDQKVAWYWNHTGWALDEAKLFETPKGGLSFDPEQVEMVISMDHTSYQHKVVFDFRK